MTPKARRCRPERDVLGHLVISLFLLPYQKAVLHVSGIQWQTAMGLAEAYGRNIAQRLGESVAQAKHLNISEIKIDSFLVQDTDQNAPGMTYSSFQITLLEEYFSSFKLLLACNRHS